MTRRGSIGMTRTRRVLSGRKPEHLVKVFPTRAQGRFRPLLLPLVILMAATTAAFITVFTLPVAVSDAPNIFTPSQWQAIADKRAALQASATNSGDGSEGYGQLAFRAQATEPPVAPNAGVGTRQPSVTYPLFMCERLDESLPWGETNCKPLDVMNVFFGGVGSAEDVAYDMTHPAYGNQLIPAERYPTEPHDRWEERNCGTGTDFCALFGTEPRRYSADILSRQIYYAPANPFGGECDRDEIGQIFHLRV